MCTRREPQRWSLERHGIRTKADPPEASEVGLCLHSVEDGPRSHELIGDDEQTGTGNHIEEKVQSA